MEIRFIPLGFREAASPAVNDLDLLDSEQRYMYSMEQIRKAEEAWTLCAEDGDSIVMDACGKECICLWPNRSAAQHFLQEVPSEDGVPYQVGLKELVRVSKKMAAEAQYAFIVYPTATGGCIVPPQQLFEDLTGENLLLKPRRTDNVAE